MTTSSRLRGWAGGGVLLLVTAMAAVSLPPALATPSQTDPGCQSSRRTVPYKGGVVTGRGTWVPCLVSTGMATGHSGLGIDDEGTLLRSVVPQPAGIAVSTNEGRSWVRRALPAGAPDGASDSYLDPVTNRFYYWGLVVGQPGPVYYTDDQGRSWKNGTFDSPLRFDWPRMFSGRPVSPRASGWKTNVYFCDWSSPAVSTVGCYVSIDGGATFTTAGLVTPQNCVEPLILPGLTFGRGQVDPRTGYIYMPAKECGKYYLYVSRDEGRTWVARVVPESRTIPLTVPLTPALQPAFQQQLLDGRNNPVSAEMASSQPVDLLVRDVHGRLYFGWIDGYDFLPYLSTSDDAGRTWTAPVQLSPPGVTGTTMLSLAMDPNGRLGISYYGTTDEETYTGYLAVVDHPGAPAPTIQTATVTPPGQPLMNEPCCWASGTQEYSSARWAPDGSLWASFATSKPTEDPGLGVVGRLVPRS